MQRLFTEAELISDYQNVININSYFIDRTVLLLSSFVVSLTSGFCSLLNLTEAIFNDAPEFIQSNYSWF